MQAGKYTFLQDANDDSQAKKPVNTVDMVIFTAIDGQVAKNSRNHSDKILQVLLIKRKKDGQFPGIADPYAGKWAVPGGNVNYYEDLDAAAVRELKAKTNVENVYLEQLYTCGKVYRDCRQRVISTSYMALADSSKLDVQPGEDAEDARWFTVTSTMVSETRNVSARGIVRERVYDLKLVNGEVELTERIYATKTVSGNVAEMKFDYRRHDRGLAFDHASIIFCALERLKNKVEYTDLAFALVPELFTLTELKKLYEVLTGKKIYDKNFRDKMEKQKKMVIETDEWSEGKRYRRAKLFRFNPLWIDD